MFNSITGRPSFLWHARVDFNCRKPRVNSTDYDRVPWKDKCLCALWMLLILLIAIWYIQESENKNMIWIDHRHLFWWIAENHLVNRSLSLSNPITIASLRHCCQSLAEKFKQQNIEIEILECKTFHFYCHRIHQQLKTVDSLSLSINTPADLSI